MPLANPSAELAVHRKRESSADGLIRRSMHAMQDLFSPFSSSALSSLPTNPRGVRDRSTRTDNIPDPESNGVLSTGHRDYNSINATLPPGVRVPKKIATPIKVEAKVWFANERTWISYLNLSILLGSLALALFNASNDSIAQAFALFYAAISVGVLVYGYVLYQKRITMIRKRDPGNFDQIIGPVIIAVLLFFAVLSNFIIRVKEMKRATIP